MLRSARPLPFAAVLLDGALAGNVVWQDAGHFTFSLVGAPPTDPGLKFSR
jgi:hypothetical protein